MWLVRIALSRPYTFIVIAIFLFIAGVVAIKRTATDIFPSIDIPVISVVWSYVGLPPDAMANQITANFERAVTTTVEGIEHIESESLNGVSVTKLYFHPRINVDRALSEVTAISQTLLRMLPPGTLPPFILRYNASTVPVMQVILSSKTLPEQKLNDIATNFLRTQLATVQGAVLPSPYGGKIRQILVDLNPKAMQMYQVSAAEINTAINAQNLTLPAGLEKMGLYEYYVKMNSMPKLVDQLNYLPVKAMPNGIIYVKDVAHVRDGFAPQTNIVRVDGQRAVMMSIQKSGNSSTLDIVRRVKSLMIRIKDSLPRAVNISIFADQSLFVSSAIKSVILEGCIAALLTGAMILLFLGSWYSTAIITISIPLSILASLAMLSVIGEMINIMTLGGLGLAVGILVDDATVAIENINWNLAQHKPIEQAILDGADQIATPAFVSTLCICIVFVPMFFLGGVAQCLFVPLAEAVIFAMLASYFLSRTLVPTLAKYWLQKQAVVYENTKNLHHLFERNFDKLRTYYSEKLTVILQRPALFVVCFGSVMCVSLLCLWPWLGANFFPSVDAGQIKLHFQASAGLRIEETARLADRMDAVIRRVIPSDELDTVVDNIGLPVSGINLTYSNSATTGPSDGDILISLSTGHRASDFYIHQLRDALRNAFPGVRFSFLPADIVNQIVNFGLPSAIVIQVVGSDLEVNKRYAYTIMRQLKRIAGVVDVRLRQSFNYPELQVNVDRSRASELGLTQRDIAYNVLVALSGSFQTTPNFWVDLKNGVAYPVVTQIPQYAMHSVQALKNILLTSSWPGYATQILGAVVDIKQSVGPSVVSHYNVQPVVDIFAGVQDRDLGAVGSDVKHVLHELAMQKPKSVRVLVEGQIATREKAFSGLYIGLAFSIILIYLLIVINFQSWLDAGIIITALPAALSGIAWILFITNTTLSVPALTGAILCMGVATANSILVISFAKDRIEQGDTPMQAALSAGVTRIRPVLMTAFAMILGMLPMAFSLGQGSESNAPLGRAVIGGLLFATVATLFFVPAIFCMAHQRRERYVLRER